MVAITRYMSGNCTGRVAWIRNGLVGTIGGVGEAQTEVCATETKGGVGALLAKAQRAARGASGHGLAGRFGTEVCDEEDDAAGIFGEYGKGSYGGGGGSGIVWGGAGVWGAGVCPEECGQTEGE